jgi:hypothetical protein
MCQKRYQLIEYAWPLDQNHWWLDLIEQTLQLQGARRAVMSNREDDALRSGQLSAQFPHCLGVGQHVV